VHPAGSVIYYSAHCTGARTRAALRKAGFGLLGSAAYRWTDPDWRPLAQGGLGWAVDNGAWSAYRAGRTFDGAAFVRAVAECGPTDWIVCPDVVCDWDGTVALRDRWLDRLLSETPHRILLPVQDGAEPGDVRALLGARVGLFVGGSTPWKLATMRRWCDLAHASGAHAHVGRVNSARRIAYCRAAGADSADGSGCSQFSDTAEHIAAAVRGPLQTGLW
jgi:hypothetical protein